MKKTRHLLFILVAVLMNGTNILIAQRLSVPDVSQKAEVMQRIGLTDIKISYHSPLAKNRVIWGELVPYGEVWRAGANENTTIAFSTDVNVEGHPLKAGTYGLHMIPEKEEWTIIFSNNSTSWGSFFYDQAEDALRIKVVPVAVPYQDWLSYQFMSIQSNSALVNLHWEKVSVSFKAEADVHEIVYKSMVEELRGINGFSWEAHLQAARYCLLNDIHLSQGRTWLDKSIRMQENSQNLFTLSDYQKKEGKEQEANATAEKAKMIATEAELNAYGYTLLGEKKTKEAIETFRLNIKKHPDSWNVYDSLGEALDADDKKAEALKYYRTALAKSPEVQHKRIEQIIKRLEGH